MVSGLEEIGIRDDEEPTLIFIPPISTRLLVKQREAFAANVGIHDDDEDETIVHGSIRDVLAGAQQHASATSPEPAQSAANNTIKTTTKTTKTINAIDPSSSEPALASSSANESGTAAATGAPVKTDGSASEDDAPTPTESARSMLLSALTPGPSVPSPQPAARGTKRTPPVILLEQPLPEPGKTRASQGAKLVEWLSTISLFRGMHTRYIDRIARLGVEERHAAGTYIFRHGDHGEDLYILLEGTLQVQRTIEEIGEESLALLRPGHHFGEMSFLDSGAKRSADLRVRHAARVLRLPMRPLRDLMFVDRDLAHDLLWRFVHDLTKRVRDSNDRLSMLASSSRF